MPHAENTLRGSFSARASEFASSPATAMIGSHRYPLIVERRYANGKPLSSSVAKRCLWQSPILTGRHACKSGLDCLVSKRRDRLYRAGHSPDWIKVKNRSQGSRKRSYQTTIKIGSCVQ
jgi:hypothetical protein